VGTYTRTVKTFIEFGEREIEQSITDRFEEQARRYDADYRLPDGYLVHMGRKDFQTKIRGHGVECRQWKWLCLVLKALNKLLSFLSGTRVTINGMAQYYTLVAYCLDAPVSPP
jgi:hypothetical protein